MTRSALALCGILLVGCITTQGRLTRSALRASDAADRRQYVLDLQQHARALHLASAKMWMRLGHWRLTNEHVLLSEADGENFFLSPDGPSDPERELDATIAGFFADLAPFDAKAADNKNIQHPICQFPARFAWLSHELAIDPARLPQVDCARYREFRDSLQAESVTLVFSAYYLNNPASAFGHTFLRIKKQNAAVPEDRRQLLDYGVDFSADPDTKFAPLYAIKGMIGAFPGTFRKVPFYFKVRQYNDFESRDLWEYKLHLSPAQLDMLIAHIWEVGSTYFAYYYLTENCSYHILGLLEAAVPEVDLIDHLHWPVIPVDAVKAVTANPGFVDSIDYRPSARTRFRDRIAALPSAELDAVAALADDPATPLPFDQAAKIDVLDAAQDLIDLRYAKELLKDAHAGTGAQIKQKLLERRAEIGVASPEQVADVPWAKMPQLGHDSRRISIGAGSDTNSDHWVSIGARLALHDLADPTAGYPELSQLEFLPTLARYDTTQNRFHLDQLDLVHIVSLTSQDRFDRHVSWEFRLGSERLTDRDCPDCYAAHVQLGGGVAFSTRCENATIFLLADTQVWSGPRIDGVLGAPVRVGIGPSGGFRWRLAPTLVALFLGGWNWLPAQPDVSTATWNVSGTLRWAIAHAVAFDLEASDVNATKSGVVSTMIYF